MFKRSRKNTPAGDGFQADENPFEVLKKKIFRLINRLINRWLGRKLGAVLIVFGLLWFTWGTVEKLPGVTWVLMKVVEVWKGVPQAHSDKFSILIAKLDNDTEGLHRRLIADALQARFDKDE